jgi:cytochrome b561/polyisoprenoid-binding protein YceI
MTASELELSPQRYSLIAIILHWTIAALIMFQIALGWGMGRTFGLVQLHKSIGISILVLSLARLAVRFAKPRPAAAEGGATGALAKIVHAGLYVFMIATPLSGWAIVSTSKLKIPTLLFGAIPLPHLPLPRAMHEGAESAHGLLVWMGLALFLLHVAGAARHHALFRDGLIYRMTPVRSALVMWALIALIPLGLFGAKALTGFAPPPKAVAASAPPAAAAPAPTAEGPVAAPAPEAAVANAAENSTAPAETGPPPHWTVVPGGSLTFALGNDGEAVTGSFSRWTAAIAMDPEHPESAKLRVDVDVASAAMGDPTQQQMVGGSDFLDSAAHPKAVFQASGAERTGADSYRAAGTLTLKGVSAPQTIRFTLKGSGDSRRVSGSATIKRSAYGVGVGDSAASLDPEVKLTFAFSATR